MAWTRNAWNNFKTRPAIWFFYGFVLTSPLSIRKVIFDYPLLGKFNEYSGIYVYLSDIFLALTIGVWGVSIIYNKLYISSTYSSANASSLPGEPRLFHPNTNVPRGTKYAILCLPAILVLWSFITILWSEQAEIAAYRSLKLFEFYLLYLFLVLNVRCSTKAKSSSLLRNIFHLIIAVGLINAIIGIAQVILQHSLGLFWLKESLIGPELPGVAKIVLNGLKYIRAYGLFPHPNILGGFLFLSILLTLEYRRLFDPSANVPRGTFYEAGMEQSAPHCATQCAEWKNGLCKIYSTPKSYFLTRFCSTPEGMFHGEHLMGQAWNKSVRVSHYIFYFVLALQIVAGILAFSKSAILALIIALAYLYWHRIIKMFHPSTDVPRETARWSILDKKALFKAGRYWWLFVSGLIFSLFALLFRPDLNSLFLQSLSERVIYFDIAKKIILINPLFGVGVGQFVVNMQTYTNQLLFDWQFQPVHNVFLLIWSELGLIGLSLFGWFIWKLLQVKHTKPDFELKKVPRLSRQMFPVEHSDWDGTFGSESGTQNLLKALLIGFFVIALFDHYLWDIQQGQIMLWTVLGLMTGRRDTI